MSVEWIHKYNILQLNKFHILQIDILKRQSITIKHSIRSLYAFIKGKIYKRRNSEIIIMMSKRIMIDDQETVLSDHTCMILFHQIHVSFTILILHKNHQKFYHCKSITKKFII
jgi:hypothetical protein